MKKLFLAIILLPFCAMGAGPASDAAPGPGSDEIITLFVNTLPSLKFSSESACASPSDKVSDDFAKTLLLVDGGVIYLSALGGGESKDPDEVPVGSSVRAACEPGAAPG